ncbi:phosphoribosylglycinamide formyltransferase [Pelodictyon luteolum]|uniref:Phosphoribosylglycinamide formyltransferase n=1 Tax=Chlorobium luteolum (strain DSM 273 / BCRC 81028 / 2530) TaxID=319225 RepID=Q3B5R2_CHLL3|nr:phosphoribosylglycinamide formyltransferase [Pelodictyon luteolum]ABB23319.1 formyltetrahydrofolate-dependent phosphoribosylglycinamide formyltransferase [Pelodictyon luteolum DSM 273]
MSNPKRRLAVFCSGTGSNFMAVHKAIAERRLQAEIVLCISNRSQCGAMEFARRKGIDTLHISEKQFNGQEEFARAMIQALEAYGIETILLAGYMRKIPAEVTVAYRGNILNIHPALLPKFGGEGMYGIHVHTAVLAAGEQQSGASVHFVDEEYDRGEILLQGTVPVMEGDTPETLAARVLECEHRIYPEALEKLLLRFRQ